MLPAGLPADPLLEAEPKRGRLRMAIILAIRSDRKFERDGDASAVSEAAAGEAAEPSPTAAVCGEGAASAGDAAAGASAGAPSAGAAAASPEDASADDAALVGEAPVSKGDGFEAERAARSAAILDARSARIADKGLPPAPAPAPASPPDSEAAAASPLGAASAAPASAPAPAPAAGDAAPEGAAELASSEAFESAEPVLRRVRRMVAIFAMRSMRSWAAVLAPPSLELGDAFS
jgi:hypothetical protein